MGPDQYGSAPHLREDLFQRQSRSVAFECACFHFDQSKSEIAFCKRASQANSNGSALFICKFTFHSRQSSHFMKCKCLVGRAPREATDHQTGCLRDAWGGRGGHAVCGREEYIKMSKPSFSRSSEIFSCVCSSVGT